jgi:hypothetical protein
MLLLLILLLMLLLLLLQLHLKEGKPACLFKYITVLLLKICSQYGSNTLVLRSREVAVEIRRGCEQ